MKARSPTVSEQNEMTTRERIERIEATNALFRRHLPLPTSPGPDGQYWLPFARRDKSDAAKRARRAIEEMKRRLSIS